jgi:hypothetical protein
MVAQPRYNHRQLIQEISLDIGPAETRKPSFVMGRIGPLNPYLVAYHLVTSLAFDAGTLTLALGTSPGGAEILPATSIKALGRTDVFMIPATGPFGSNAVYATLAVTGAPATVGRATVWIDYISEPG